MIEMVQSGRGLRQLRMRSLLCLLLAVTFLHNPFFAPTSSFSGPSVSHLPSFRATVASSELIKFKPKEIIDALTIAKAELPLLAGILLPQPNSLVLHDDSNEPVPIQHFSVGNLWFRPPPVVG